MESKHAEFVRRIIGEADVRQRVAQFPAIARNFPRDVLEGCSTKAPDRKSVV